MLTGGLVSAVKEYRDTDAKDAAIQKALLYCGGAFRRHEERVGVALMRRPDHRRTHQPSSVPPPLRAAQASPSRRCSWPSSTTWSSSPGCSWACTCDRPACSSSTARPCASARALCRSAEAPLTRRARPLPVALALCLFAPALCDLSHVQPGPTQPLTLPSPLVSPLRARS